MALTAIVIGLAVTALLLALVLRVVDAYRVRDLDEVSDEEAEHDARLERRGRGRARGRGGGRPVTAALDRAGRALGGRHRAASSSTGAAARSARLAVACLAANLRGAGRARRRRLGDGPVSVTTGNWPTGVGITLRADALGVLFAALSSFALLVAAVARARSRASASAASPAWCSSSPPG